MNGTTDKSEDFGDWDDLASKLGLEPASPPKSAAKSPDHTKPLRPEPQSSVEPAFAKPFSEEPEEFGAFVEAEVSENDSEDTEVEDSVAVEEQSEADETFGDGMSSGESASDEVSMDDTADVLDDEAGPDETVAEEGAGSAAPGKRRRRRRRKKGGPKPETVAEPADEEAVADRADDVDEIAEEGPVIVGDAAPELEDDEDEDGPASVAEDLEDDSTEPLPEWKVVAWTDLIATLYRPQDR